ncbi:MAG: hypothetical protein R3256_03240 [Thalassovita sp.]|nr:hypothetical protein [Thalassovita sp.]
MIKVIEFVQTDCAFPDRFVAGCSGNGKSWHVAPGNSIPAGKKTGNISAPAQCLLAPLGCIR